MASHLVLSAFWSAVASIVLLLLRYIIFIRSLNYLPGPPPASWLWGDIVYVRKAVVGTKYNILRKQYGPVYRLRTLSKNPVLVVGDPKGASHVLTAKNSLYHRPISDKLALKLWFGPGLFTAEGEEHRRMRKILNPAFTYQSIQDIAPIFVNLGERLCSQWDELLVQHESIALDVSKPLRTLSLDAISMTMFKHNVAASAGHIPELLDKFAAGPGNNSPASQFIGAILRSYPIFYSLPTLFKAWASLLRTEMGAIAEQVWADSKRGVTIDSKILNLLGNKNGESINKDEAIAQIIGILFEILASDARFGDMTLSLKRVLMSCRHPVIQSKARQELVDFENTHQRVPGYDDLTNATALPYFESVYREVIRTKGVLMVISRTAVADDVIPLDFPILGSGAKEVSVRAGTSIQIPVRDGINVDEAIWGPDAGEFRPERWADLPETVRRTLHAQGNMLTFGDGPKVCIGRTFTLAETKIVMSTLLRSFAFGPLEDVVLDFYHTGVDTVKSKVRGRESEGMQLPLRVKRV